MNLILLLLHFYPSVQKCISLHWTLGALSDLVTYVSWNLCIMLKFMKKLENRSEIWWQRCYFFTVLINTVFLQTVFLYVQFGYGYNMEFDVACPSVSHSSSDLSPSCSPRFRRNSLRLSVFPVLHHTQYKKQNSTCAWLSDCKKKKNNVYSLHVKAIQRKRLKKSSMSTGVSPFHLPVRGEACDSGNHLTREWMLIVPIPIAEKNADVRRY